MNNPVQNAYSSHAACEVEIFVILVKGFWPLYNVTGSSALVVERVLDISVYFTIFITIIINIIFITFVIIYC